jgi:hypothetical protein
MLLNLVVAVGHGVSGRDRCDFQHSDDPALRFALERGLVERERASELQARIPAPQIVVERVSRWSSDLDLLNQIGQSLEGIPTT